MTFTLYADPAVPDGRPRVSRWRREWAAHGSPEEPLVVTPLGESLVGERALAHLGRCLPAPAERRFPAARETGSRVVGVAVPA